MLGACSLIRGAFLEKYVGITTPILSLEKKIKCKKGKPKHCLSHQPLLVWHWSAVWVRCFHPTTQKNISNITLTSACCFLRTRDL